MQSYTIPPRDLPIFAPSQVVSISGSVEKRLAPQKGPFKMKTKWAAVYALLVQLKIAKQVRQTRISDNKRIPFKKHKFSVKDYHTLCK